MKTVVITITAEMTQVIIAAGNKILRCVESW